MTDLSPLFTPAARTTPGSLSQEIRAAAARRRALHERADTNAFRLVHTGEVSLPGLALDLYDAHVVAHFSSPEASAQAAAVAASLVELGVRGVYAKFRPRQASTLVDTRRDEVAPREPIAGEAAAESLTILEGGDPFLVRLHDGLSTGIFLDQRANRARLRGLCADRRVLNLFAYACAFTVSAARGGARQVISVDISEPVLAWGRESLALSMPPDPARFRFIADEAMTFLRRCAVRGDRYDVIVLDPPSYATTKTTRFTAEHDYTALATAALAVLAPGGHLLACTNHQGISPRRFLGFLRTAAGVRPVRKLELLPAPTDFPAAAGAEPHLKAALLSLGA